MRYITPDRGRRRGRALVLGAIAAFAATAAPVHAQAPGSAKVTSTETAGMRYIGGDADNNVRFTLSGSTFTVDDRVPIEAGAGCTPVPGDATKVTCVAFKTGTKFKEFNVLTGNGNDTVVNQTSGAGLSNVGAPMRANGGPGDDELTGDARADDVLFGAGNDDELDGGVAGVNELDGGSGDDRLQGGSSRDTLRGSTGNDQLDAGASDDTLDGGTGRDVIDGGPAASSSGDRHDIVVYGTRSVSVTVDLNRTDASQGTQADPGQGISAEADTIRDIEDIAGGSGNDTLIGNAVNNRIDGSNGSDVVSGREGRDELIGGPGRDTLAPSPSFPGPFGGFGVVADGQPDLIECGQLGVAGDRDPGDQTFRVPSDGDFARDCATVVDM